MATETIIGNYRVAERIGQGGMGVVYHGYHTSLPREVAIKSIKAGSRRDLRRLRSRFEKEAYIQSQLDHPGIVKIYDYIVSEQVYYIVMEYVDGRSLAELCSSDECPLPVERALDIFEAILHAVAYAHGFVYLDQDGSSHQGLIHRDLKSANILVGPDDRVKVTDFGIVKLVGDSKTDTFSNSYGSPQYVSPEQAQGRPVDQRSDIYSLGIILYEMLTAGPPFGRRDEPLSRTEILRAHVERSPRPPSELNSEISPEVESLVLRSLEKQPEKRFATALEFLRAVRRARSRDTRDLDRSASARPPARRNGPRPLNTPDTGVTARQSYVTQPIGSGTCIGCGATVSLHDEQCPDCGRELSASPATAKLTSHDERGLRNRRVFHRWLAIAILCLGLAGAFVLLLRHRTVVTGSPTPPGPADLSSTGPPPSANLLELRPSKVSVDSSFEGYNAEPLTDGVTDIRRIAAMRYNRANWVSAETPAPHWIELEFDRAERLAAVYVYWGFDHNRFMPSRRVELQTPDSARGWEAPRTLSVLEPGSDYDRTAFEFPPVTTARVRIFQPIEEGPKGRPFVMWVREVKVFGAAESPSPQ